MRKVVAAGEHRGFESIPGNPSGNSLIAASGSGLSNDSRFLGGHFDPVLKMYQTETFSRPPDRLTRIFENPELTSNDRSRAACRAESRSRTPAVSGTRKLVDSCKILKQIADRLKNRSGGKESVLSRDLGTLKTHMKGHVRIGLSQREAEFFLDKNHRLSYHDPKFSSDDCRPAIFRLRPPEKSLNWRSCVQAGAALLLGLATVALDIEGRKLKG
jgi:hypothetical protein